MSAPDGPVTVHTVSVTLEVRDAAVAEALAYEATDWAHHVVARRTPPTAPVDFNVSTSRYVYVESQAAFPDSMVEELAERVRARLAVPPPDDVVVVDETELGRAAYAAYGRSRKGRTHDNQPMPAWDDLGDGIRRAWAAGAWAGATAYARATRAS